MTAYTSTARWESDVRSIDRHWFVQCDQVPDATSTVTQLSQADDHQRGAIAFVTGEPESDIDVAVRVDLSLDVGTELAEATYWNRVAANAEAAATEHYREAAVLLRNDGYRLRDIATVLGISHQRVYELVTQ